MIPGVNIISRKASILNVNGGGVSQGEVEGRGGVL